MPVLRYFVVAGLILLSGMFALDAMLPKQQTRAVADEANDALSNWRAAEARKSSAVRQDDPNSFAVRAPARDAIVMMPAPFAPPPSMADAFAAATRPVDAKKVESSSVVAATNIPASPVQAGAGRETSVKARSAQATLVQAKPVEALPQRSATKAVSGANTRGKSQVAIHPPSQDSLRQEAMARAALMARSGATFGPGVRQANASQARGL